MNQVHAFAAKTSFSFEYSVKVYEFIAFIFYQVHCVKCVQIRSFFWSVYSRIRTEHLRIRRISPYSVRMRDNTDQKKIRIWTLFTQW